MASLQSGSDNRTPVSTNAQAIRPGGGRVHGCAAETLAPYRRDETDIGLLAMAAPPAFIFVHGPRSPMSLTALREKPCLLRCFAISGIKQPFGSGR
jgi:hypothetical protein